MFVGGRRHGGGALQGWGERQAVQETRGSCPQCLSACMSIRRPLFLPEISFIRATHRAKGEQQLRRFPMEGSLWEARSETLTLPPVLAGMLRTANGAQNPALSGLFDVSRH